MVGTSLSQGQVDALNLMLDGGAGARPGTAVTPVIAAAGGKVFAAKCDGTATVTGSRSLQIQYKH